MPDSPPESVPAPPAFPRPDWRAAVFNYGSLVAVVIGVLGFLFVQLAELRESLARQSERIQGLGATVTALEKHTGERFDSLEKQMDQQFNALNKHMDETREDLAAIRALLLEKRSP